MILGYLKLVLMYRDSFHKMVVIVEVFRPQYHQLSQKVPILVVNQTQIGSKFFVINSRDYFYFVMQQNVRMRMENVLSLPTVLG